MSTVVNTARAASARAPCAAEHHGNVTARRRCSPARGGALRERRRIGMGGAFTRRAVGPARQRAEAAGRSADGFGRWARGGSEIAHVPLKPQDTTRAASEDVVGDHKRRPAATRRAQAWRAKLVQLAERERRAPWDIGDHLLVGERKHGITYKEAAKLTGLRTGTLWNYVSVAKAFDSSRRHEGLTFQHHAEVLGCEPEVADELLALAAAKRWSVRGLRHERRRREMRANRRQLIAAAPDDEAVDVRHCAAARLLADLVPGSVDAVISDLPNGAGDGRARAVPDALLRRLHQEQPPRVALGDRSPRADEARGRLRRRRVERQAYEPVNAKTPSVRLPPLPELTHDMVAAMPETERRAFMRRLTAYMQQLAAVQMLVAKHLDVQRDEPLWDAKQTAAVLGVHPDTVRDRGPEWGIEADLGDGIHRYIPEAVRVLRERRKDAARARLDGRSRSTG
jgi:hypothetical protein